MDAFAAVPFASKTSKSSPNSSGLLRAIRRIACAGLSP